MALDKRAVNDMNIDLENRFFNFLQKKEILDLLSEMLKKKNMKELSSMLCNDNLFPSELLLSTIEKYDNKLVEKLFDEPKSESEMAIPIIMKLNETNFRTAQEVPLPKVGKAKSRKMDVAGYTIREENKGFFKGIQKDIVIEGFELKCEGSRGAIDKAFSQAKEYQQYCENSTVAFSPILYAKYYHPIHNKAKEYQNLSVIIVGKSSIRHTLQKGRFVDISDEIQQQMVEYINIGKK